MRFSLFPRFFSVSFLYALYSGYLTWPWFSGPIHHVHSSSVQGGVGDITHSPIIIFLSFTVQR
jgi:hypothetical protein